MSLAISKTLTFRVLPLVLCFCPVAGFAKDPIEWPNEPRSQLEAEFFSEAPDGYLEERMILKGSEFNLLFGITKRWKESGSNLSPRFSYVLESARGDGVILGVSVFEEGEFLADLSDESWNGYLASLDDYDPRAEVTFTHNSLERSEPPMILNSVYRQVDYVQEFEAESRRKTREIFAEIRGKLVVFSFVGSAEVIDSNRRLHNLLLTRMDLLEK